MDGYHPVLGLAILAAMALSFLAVLIALVILIWKRKWIPTLLIAIAALCIYPLWWHWLTIWEEQQQSLKAAKGIALVCMMYASEHGNKYPEKLEYLIPTYLPSFQGLEQPGPAGGSFGYDYFGGSPDDPPSKILLQAHTPYHGKRAVVYNDMSGALVPAGQ